MIYTNNSGIIFYQMSLFIKDLVKIKQNPSSFSGYCIRVLNHAQPYFIPAYVDKFSVVLLCTMHQAEPFAVAEEGDDGVDEVKEGVEVDAFVDV